MSRAAFAAELRSRLERLAEDEELPPSVRSAILAALAHALDADDLGSIAIVAYEALTGLESPRGAVDAIGVIVARAHEHATTVRPFTHEVA